jgi:hypothetical protein
VDDDASIACREAIARIKDITIQMEMRSYQPHGFAFLAEFPGAAGPSDVEDWEAAARDYASKNKGGMPRGLGAALAVVVGVVTPAASDELTAWAQHPRGGRFALFAFPLVVDVDRRKATGPVCR